MTDDAEPPLNDDGHPVDEDGNLICGASKTQSDGYCTLSGGWGVDDADSGRCKYHGGCGGAPEGNQNAEGNSGGSAPQNNQNATKHGLYSESDDAYFSHLAASEQDYVEELASALVERLEGVKESIDRMDEEQCKHIALDMQKKTSANEYILREGLVQDIVVDTDEQGNPIAVEEANHLHDVYSRLSRDITKQMKELGILEDPESQNAEATKSLAEVIAERT